MVYRSRDIQYVSVGLIPGDCLVSCALFSYHTHYHKGPTNQPGFDHNLAYVIKNQMCEDCEERQETSEKNNSTPEFALFAWWA